MTDLTRAVVRRMFADGDHLVVEALLDAECGVNLPLTDRWDEAQFERLWLAVLKLSRGDMARLREWIVHAQGDWRDLLVWSGFQNTLKAQQWAKEQTT